MVCLVNYARDARPPTGATVASSTVVARQGDRIVRCLDFNHDACGEAPEADIRALGYHGAWGENLFISGGLRRAAAVTRRLAQLAGSPANLFRPSGARRGSPSEDREVGQDRNMTLWVNQFATLRPRRRSRTRAARR